MIKNKHIKTLSNHGVHFMVVNSSWDGTLTWLVNEAKT